MESNPRVRVKICCIASVEEAHLAIAQGASAVGLVSRMPSGPGVIDEGRIAEITAAVPPGVATFLLTSEIDVPAIIDQQCRTRVNTLQLVDALQPGAHQQLREALPGIALIQVVHVVGEQSIADAVAIAPQVNAILLDSGNPAAPVKELGGTGRVHNWEISRRIRQSISCPLFVAGGLQPANVRQAISQIGPYAVDVCSGVRTNGHLDAIKLRDFFREVEAATSSPL